MKPTRISNLVLALGATAVVGFTTLQQLEGNGLATPNTNLSILLVQPILAVALVLMATPMIRYRNALKKFEDSKGKRPEPVGSNYAVSTLGLAKSMSLAGSLLAGLHLALLVYRVILLAGEATLLPSLGLLGSVALIVAGLVVENLFRIPPDRDGESA